MFSKNGTLLFGKDKVVIVFNVDLDNTLIYSYKHDIGNDKLEVELYKGKNISYVTRKTYELLKQLKKKVLIVPTTTRTARQYKRIDLKIGSLKYALVCNGGILLVDGIVDLKWYKDSLEMISESKAVLQEAVSILENDKRRIFDVKFINNLFVFTKCNEPENVVAKLKAKIDLKNVDVINNGAKVYVVPKKLSKGNAVRRFKNYINSDKIIAAGDSVFDISMFTEADVAIAPMHLGKTKRVPDDVVLIPQNKVFSEELITKILTDIC